MTLYEMRNTTIAKILNLKLITSVLDLGCGDGRLIKLLYNNNIFDNISGVDISSNKIKRLKNIYTDDSRVTFYEQSFFEYNNEFKKYDAIILSEVIEHLDKEDVFKLLNLIFKVYVPKILIITTPNRSYNYHYEILHNGLRHASHIFELSDQDVVLFTENIRKKYNNYKVKHGYCDNNHASHLIISELY